MPNFSAKWGLMEQLQAVAAGTWTGIPLPQLYAWASNSSGQLGDGTVVSRSSPIQVGALTDWSQAAAGFSHSAAIKTNGTIWTWGGNGSGQLGQNDVISRSSPVQVGALTNWRHVSVGIDFNASVKTDGTLWTWGNNSDGRLGQNDSLILRSSPVQVGALTNWSRVDTGNNFGVAVKTDGTLWTWGGNDAGQLGDNTGVFKSSPVQVGALTNWYEVSAFGYNVSATKTNGTLWGWGNNSAGAVGQSDTVNRSSPVQVGALTTWSSVAAGNAFTLAVKTDASLWGWGINTSGQLGDGTAANKSSPVQIGSGLFEWAKASGGSGQSFAIRNSGALWAWGSNGAGRLGDGTVIYRSSPVQIGSLTGWYAVSPGFAFNVAILQGSTN